MRTPLAHTAPALLDELTGLQPDHCFVIDTDRGPLGTKRWNYGEFNAAVKQHAAGLVALGVSPGTRIGILMGNRVEWLLSYFAALSIGAEVVALNTWLTVPELKYQLRHAGVRILIAEANFVGTDWTGVLAEISRQDPEALSALERTVWLGALDEGGNDGINELVAAGTDETAARAKAYEAGIKASDVGCILYTSGSTARAKGVPLTHGGLVANMWCIGERMHLTPADRLWLGVSLFWSFACVNAVFTLLSHGGSIVLQHHFDAGPALDLIDEHQCTVFYGTPNMIHALSEHPSRPAVDLSSLRTGATIGTTEQLKRAIAFGIPELCNVYGLTEAYGNSVVSDAKTPADHRIHYQGKVLESQQLRVVDPDSRIVLAAGETGELELGGCVTPGYLDDPERTAESFTADGFLKTGDLGRLDENGYLQYRGRLKEMIKTNGINVSPAEVEDVLAAHPAIEHAFVIGIPDDKADEAVVAVVVGNSTAAADEAALRGHCRKVLAAYKVPRRIIFCAPEQLPQTATGKLQRNRLHELFA